jgi:malate synthase
VAVDLPWYLDFLPEPLRAALDSAAEPVPEVPGLRVAAGLRADFPEEETPEALAVAVEVYREVRGRLAEVLGQREADRAFVDAYTLSCVAHNAARDYRDPAYQTVVGARDQTGRVVVGPLCGPVPAVQVDVPAFLAGDQVTLFGPPGSARMCIHALNSLHRRRPDEPALVAELVASSGAVPRWGADDEDSRTPIMRSFLQAGQNLRRCVERTIRADGLQLAERGLAIPIKRVPGLALPDGSHLLDGNPLPLHLYDLVSHVWHHRRRPEALVLYVPKLENEEEAGYLRALVEATERAVASRDPGFVPGAIRLLLVFENPRAIFRIREMAAALGPYFLGGSLGWHDFLASTARLFRHDPRYRIPVKADPNIVIERIQASHRRLVTALGDCSALTIGGMYGVLFEDGDPASFQVSMVGYVRDVTTQLKRGLRGFWVAHPDFVRIGIALVEAWRRRERDPQDGELVALIRALVPDPVEQEPLLAFVLGPDRPGLPEDDPLYPRAVLAADLQASPLVANHDPEEVRYNVFQALQYLADWLGGNGCVALPATMRNARGESVAVRIMDDLATTERSRWELWAEVHHGRVSAEQFDQILSEEVEYLRAGLEQPRRIQVRWEGEAARWYPIAAQLLRELVVTSDPPEFVSEWTLPFTFPLIRDAADPWAAARALCPGRYPGLQVSAG